MIKGEANKTSKLTNKDIFNIRLKYDAGEKVSEIAKLFGISRIHVIRIGKREVWRHI